MSDKQLPADVQERIMADANKCDNIHKSNDYRIGFNYGYIAGATSEALRKKPGAGWVKASERLPEANKHVPLKIGTQFFGAFYSPDHKMIYSLATHHYWSTEDYDLMAGIEWLDESGAAANDLLQLQGQYNELREEFTLRMKDIADLEAEIKEYKDVLADKQRLIREIDVVINGDKAAKQATLGDIFIQLRKEWPQRQSGAIWIKGQYDQLYKQVKAGKRVSCYVDYKPWHSEGTFRDICTIGESMEFVSRGHGYGRVDCGAYTGTEQERFIQMCTELNVEWVNAAGSTEATIINEPPKRHAGAHMRCENKEDCAYPKCMCPTF